MKTYGVLAVPCQWKGEPTPAWFNSVATWNSNTAAWYRTGSYGQHILNFTLAAPVTLSKAQNDPTWSYTMFPAYSGYDRVTYFTTRTQTPSIGYKGLQWGTLTWVNSADSDYGPFAFIHELGHSFGLQHPQTLNGLPMPLPPYSTTTGGSPTTMYDKSTSMGYEATYAEFSMFQKAKLGWVVPAVYSGGDQTYTLTASRTRGGALYAVRIPCAQFAKTGASNRVYWLEYRDDTVGENGIQLRIEQDFCAVSSGVEMCTHYLTPAGFAAGSQILDANIQIDIVTANSIRVRPLQAKGNPVITGSVALSGGNSPTGLITVNYPGDANNNAATAYFNPDGSPYVPPAQQTVPPLASVTDSTGAVWTLDPNNGDSNGQNVLRNGQWAAGGRATLISYKNSQIKVENASKNWYLWQNNGWTATSAP